MQPLIRHHLRQGIFSILFQKHTIIISALYFVNIQNPSKIVDVLFFIPLQE